MITKKSGSRNRAALFYGEVFAYGKSEVVRSTVKFEALPQVKLILQRAKSVIRRETTLLCQYSQGEVIFAMYSPTNWNLLSSFM